MCVSVFVCVRVVAFVRVCVCVQLLFTFCRGTRHSQPTVCNEATVVDGKADLASPLYLHVQLHVLRALQ